MDDEVQRCSRLYKHEYKPLAVDWCVIAQALVTACPTDVMAVFVLVKAVSKEVPTTTFLPLFVASSFTTRIAWFKQLDNKRRFSSILIR